jgi:hypothetical protein
LSTSLGAIWFFVLMVSLGASQPVRADAPGGMLDEPFRPTLRTTISDAEAYITAPLRWDRKDWSKFGGSLAAVALAHHFDSTLHHHFTRRVTNTLAAKDSTDLKDALPAAALLAGAWVAGTVSDAGGGKTAPWTMGEAAVLAAGTTYVLKAVAGRERPNQTVDPNRWRMGGSSFPSLHVSAAFALGTAFAESGAEDTRWLTRTIGYGVAGLTAMNRLKHNAHWLSDTVAGAALGAATGLFVVHRTYRTGILSNLIVVPADRGLMLTYHRELP